MGSYGYDWNINTGTSPERRGFDRTLRLAENTKADIKWDKESWNNTFSYRADDGSDHEVWFLDAVSAWNQYFTAQQKKFRGVSLAHLGNEDPSVWKFVSTSSLDATPAWDEYISATKTQTGIIASSGAGNEETTPWKFLSSTDSLSAFDPRALENIPYNGSVVTHGTGKMYKILSPASK